MCHEGVSRRILALVRCGEMSFEKSDHKYRCVVFRSNVKVKPHDDLSTLVSADALPT